jgi:uncharacterized membrane protein YphA (DoxX/SURF4 family)
MKTRLLTLKIISRGALGIVWFYEGLVPKVLFLRADEIALVQKSHLVWGTPELTLRLMGIAQIALGIWLIIGVAERIAVVVATLWMSILIVLVASGNRSMLLILMARSSRTFALWPALSPFGCCRRSQKKAAFRPRHNNLCCIN